MKMNKNQKRFFELAQVHFGKEKSKKLMLKEIRKFAESSGLIIPTTVLQQVCKIKRGWFDLTKAGVDVVWDTFPTNSVEPDAPKVPTLDDFVPEEPIKEVSMYADQPVSDIRTSSLPDVRTPKQKKKDVERPTRVFRNPVYVLQGDDNEPISVFETFQQAWAKKYVALHDHGNISEKEAEAIIEERHRVMIRSSNSGLVCRIFKLDLNV